jgi:isoleucyl-tRNA synthetase
MRFLLGNLQDFDPKQNTVEFDDMPLLDQWALTQLNALVAKVTEAYESYNFYKVYHLLNQFFTVELSATYLDIIKDRLYTWKANGRQRRSSQTVIHELLKHLTPMMAPILSFTAEEVYSYLKGEQEESIFLESFPQYQSTWVCEENQEVMGILLSLRSAVSKTLEELRKEKVIGSSLDARVSLTLPPKDFEKVRPFSEDLKEVLIVSQLDLVSGPELKVEAEPAKGDKCPRCWHYSEKLSRDERWPGVCPKCLEALN